MGLWDSIKGAKAKHDQKKTAKREARENYRNLLAHSDLVEKLIYVLHALPDGNQAFSWIKQGDSYEDYDMRVLSCSNDGFLVAATHYAYSSYLDGEIEVKVRTAVTNHDYKIMFSELGYDPLQTPVTLETSMEGVVEIILENELHEMIEDLVLDGLKEHFTDCTFVGRKTFRNKDGYKITDTLSVAAYEVPRPARKGWFS